MNTFTEKINKNSLHHGYLIVGEREASKIDLFDFLEREINIATIGNPDFASFDFNTLSIAEARELARMQERKGFSETHLDGQSGRKFFVISTNIITDEAQNALLKVFEEPTPGTHFFILASQNTFLPTFLSRLQIINQSSTREEKHEAILDKSISERLALVAKLAGDISDEKKTKQDAIDLVNQIESELYQLSVDPTLQITVDGQRKNTHALTECQFARTALFSRGAMTKMILENLMLQL